MLVSDIARQVAAICPYDDLESRHIENAVAWLNHTDDVFRRRKPDVPLKHLVSYFVVLDEAAGEILLVDHRKAGLLLPTGGHVEPGENPWAACAREAKEELHLDARSPSWLGREPLFITETETVGHGKHVDVSFWFVLSALKQDVSWFDEDEFTGIHWLTYDEIVSTDSSRMDPHMKRFVNKLLSVGDVQTAQNLGSTTQMRNDDVVTERAEPKLIVVSGVPGSGKTTLGRALAEAMGIRFLDLDTIKETLFESSGGSLDGVALRLAAEAKLRKELASDSEPAVVDIWIQPGRDDSRVAQWLGSGGSPAIEVICQVSGEVAVDRYKSRTRSGPHRPADPETLQRIRNAANALGPIGIGPSIRVDTTQAVDIEGLINRIDQSLKR